MAIEEEFGIEIPDAEADEITTVAQGECMPDIGGQVWDFGFWVIRGVGLRVQDSFGRVVGEHGIISIWTWFKFNLSARDASIPVFHVSRTLGPAGVLRGDWGCSSVTNQCRRSESSSAKCQLSTTSQRPLKVSYFGVQGRR